MHGSVNNVFPRCVSFLRPQLIPLYTEIAMGEGVGQRQALDLVRLQRAQGVASQQAGLGAKHSEAPAAGRPQLLVAWLSNENFPMSAEAC